MIGNNGVRIEPRIIRRIGPDSTKPEPGVQVVKPETAQTVMQCMEAVMQSGEGTGAKLRIPGYRMAGKTGTAQKVGKGEHGYVSNFVGFVPAPNPKALILVMVNNPKGIKYYGADVAGPVFSDIAKAVIRKFNIPPTEPITEKPERKISASEVDTASKIAEKDDDTP
jgi:cell division protein FtsI/penicillin-binding protein 2